MAHLIRVIGLVLTAVRADLNAVLGNIPSDKNQVIEFELEQLGPREAEDELV